MLGYERVKRVILESDNPTDRKIRFLALLTSAIPKGVSRRKPVLIGGSAIEIYLDGFLRTGDIDIMYNVADLKKILKAWQFETGPALRSYMNEELGLAVDLVGDRLNASYDKITTITTDYGPVAVIGVEDLVLKRLASAKFWKATADMEQCYLLARSREGKIDWNYLESQAKKEDNSDYLRKLRNSLGKG